MLLQISDASLKKKHTLQALHEIVWLSLEAPQTFLKHNQTLTFEQGLAHAREIYMQRL